MREKVLSLPFLKKLAQGAGAEWSKDNAMRLSAALSYYSTFSLAPLLLIAVGIAGRVYGAEAAQGKIASQLTTVMGPQAAEALQTIVKSAGQTGSGATIIGFIILLAGASGVFGQLKGALDTIWEVRPKSSGAWGFIREQLLSFGMVLAIGFLLLISLIMAAVVAGSSEWVEVHLGLPKLVSALTGFILPLFLETILFALIFKVLPSARIAWNTVWIGAVFTAVFFELGKLGLSFYLARGSTTSSFGAAGSLVIILLWVYYASCILFFGAEITEVYARLTGQAIQPDRHAVTTETAPPPVTAGDAAPPAFPSPFPAQPHLMSDQPLPPAPRHETLTPLLARTVTPNPEHVQRAAFEAARSRTFLGRLQNQIARCNDYPVIEFGAAVGLGIAAGVASRLLDRETK